MIKIYRKSKAMGATIRTLKLVEETYQESHGISVAAYKDPYVEGFLFSVIAQIAIHVGKIRTPEGLLEFRFKALAGAYGSQNAVAILDRAGLCAEAKDPDFLVGVEAAQDAFQSNKGKFDRVPPKEALEAIYRLKETAK